VRAISFMIVFLSHAGLKGKVPGYFGLSVFFFLSGYLITTLLRKEFDQTGAISLRHFYLRRAYRILPPFYITLAIAYSLTAAGFWGGSIGPYGIAAQVLHVTNYYIVANGWWDQIAPGTWVYWSLAVEEHFYLGFPLLYLVLRRLGLGESAQARVLLAIALAVLAWRCVLVFGFDAPKDRVYVATDTRIDSILAGCLLAVWSNPMLDRSGPSDRRLNYLWLPLGGLAVLVSLMIRHPIFEQTLRYTLQSFGLLPFFVAAVRYHEHPPFSWLNTRLLRYLGVLSYAMYLAHTSVIWGFDQRTQWPEPLKALAALLVVTAFAAAMHHCVERPFAQLRRRAEAT
jgi:peptidoglycan/LPS O-acetylase OafA/YrhL